jgi:hypothetical protein
MRPEGDEGWHGARIRPAKVAHGLARYTDGNWRLDEIVDPRSGRDYYAGRIEVCQGSHTRPVSHIDAARKGCERSIGSDDARLRLEHSERSQWKSQWKSALHLIAIESLPDNAAGIERSRRAFA